MSEATSVQLLSLEDIKKYLLSKDNVAMAKRRAGDYEGDKIINLELTIGEGTIAHPHPYIVLSKILEKNSKNEVMMYLGYNANKINEKLLEKIFPKESGITIRKFRDHSGFCSVREVSTIEEVEDIYARSFRYHRIVKSGIYERALGVYEDKCDAAARHPIEGLLNTFL